MKINWEDIQEATEPFIGMGVAATIVLLLAIIIFK
jgi:hypothetical protein